MSEYPILFNGEMVRAILEGHKTQTRRPIDASSIAESPHGGMIFFCKGPHHGNMVKPKYCPYGQPGDILWVRETWQTTRSLDHCKPSGIAHGASIQYIADGWNKGFGLPDAGKHRPSIFMIPWMSRIRLRVKSVRVERVQDITEEDSIAEGVRPALCMVTPGSTNATPIYRSAFMDTWNATYRTWDANPWVWAIEFERVEVL